MNRNITAKAAGWVSALALILASPAYSQSIKFDGPNVGENGVTRTAPNNVSATNPLPVTGQGGGVTLTDGSGSVATGGTSQQAFAANASRKYLYCQNPSATISGVSAESLFVNIGASASNAGTSFITSTLTVNGVSGKCNVAVLSLSIVTAGLTVIPTASSSAGMSVQVFAIPLTQ